MQWSKMERGYKEFSKRAVLQWDERFGKIKDKLHKEEPHLSVEGRDKPRDWKKYIRTNDDDTYSNFYDQKTIKDIYNYVEEISQELEFFKTENNIGDYPSVAYNFRNVEFSEDAEFVFEDIVFKGMVSFHDSKGCFLFRNCTFERGGTFLPDSHFENCVLKGNGAQGEYAFTSEPYRSHIIFLNCKTENRAVIHLGAIKFTSVTPDEGCFTMKNREDSAPKFCDGSSFGLFDIGGNDFSRGIEFIEVKFLGETKFNNCAYGGALVMDSCTFNKAPEFFSEPDRTFFTSTIFRKCNFISREASEEGSYRALKEKLFKIGADAQASEFYAYELECRRKQLSKKSDEWWLSWVYCLINNYGQSLIRPFWGIAGCFVLFFSIMSLGDIEVFVEGDPSFYYWSGESGEGAIEAVKPWGSLESKFIYSLKTVTGPIRLFILENVTIKSPVGIFFSIMFGLVSTLLWYMLIVGVNRRFKLKS